MVGHDARHLRLSTGIVIVEISHLEIIVTLYEH